MKPYDVTSTFVQLVDVEPRDARQALTGIDPMRSLADRPSALGLDDRAQWCKGSEAQTYSLAAPAELYSQHRSPGDSVCGQSGRDATQYPDQARHRIQPRELGRDLATKKGENP